MILAGCKREEQPPPPDPLTLPTGPPTLTPLAALEEKEPHAAGKKVYNAQGCMRCHTMGGAKDAPKDAPAGDLQAATKGPDLAKVGGKPGRDVEWFIAFV